MERQHVPAFVRITGPSNSNFLIGYPGISATVPRVEGKVEIRPAAGWSAPVKISLVTVSLVRKETIHPAADGLKKRLAAPRRELVDTVGKEMLLYRTPAGKEFESVLLMDLPFVIFIPIGRSGDEPSLRVPPASITLPSRTAETSYELVVSLHQGHSDSRKFAFPVPISRFDTLSTFGMYNRPEHAEQVSDHLVTMGISLPRSSYGPLDPVSVYIQLSPNPDWMGKAKKVTVQKITVSIEEEIVYNHEGDEPTRKSKTLAKNQQNVGVRLPESGYYTNLGFVFPFKDLRDNDGVLPRPHKAFPLYTVHSFTTTASLYKIEFFLTVKAQLSNARDIVLRQPIVVCPYDHAGCKEEMEAIEQAAKDATHVRAEEPMVPASHVVRANDPNGLRAFGMCYVGSQRKPLIE